MKLRMMEVVVTTGAISLAKFQLNRMGVGTRSADQAAAGPIIWPMNTCTFSNLNSREHEMNPVRRMNCTSVHATWFLFWTLSPVCGRAWTFDVLVGDHVGHWRICCDVFVMWTNKLSLRNTHGISLNIWTTYGSPRSLRPPWVIVAVGTPLL